MNQLRPDRELREKVVKIVATVLGERFDAGGHRLELTSLQMLEVIVALEDEFAIHISEDEPLARITSSIESIVKYLHRAVDQAGAPLPSAK